MADIYAQPAFSRHNFPRSTYTHSSACMQTGQQYQLNESMAGVDASVEAPKLNDMKLY